MWVVFLPVARLSLFEVFRNLRATDLNLLLSGCDLAEAFLYSFFKTVALIDIIDNDDFGAKFTAL